MMYKLHGLIILFVLLFLNEVRAQSRLDHTFIGEKQGLNGYNQWSSNSIAVDKYGFVWFCTMGGLNRWDGYTIKSYGKVSYNGRDLLDKKISAIAVDKNNNLWLGTQEAGIIFFDVKNEKFIPFKPSQFGINGIDFTQINKLIIDSANVLYICTAFHGAYKYDIDLAQCTPFTKLNKVSKGALNTMLLSNNQKLIFLGTKGIFYEQQKGQFKLYAVDPKIYLSEIVEIEEEKFIIYSSNIPEQFIFDYSKNQLTKINNDIPHSVVNAILDKNKNLWTSYGNNTFSKENLLTKTKEYYSLIATLRGKDFPVSMKGMLVDQDKVYFMSLASGAGYFNISDPTFSLFLDKSYSNLKKVKGKLFAAKGDTILHINNDKKEVLLTLNPEHKSDFILDYIITEDQGIFVSHIGQNAFISHFDTNGRFIRTCNKCNSINYFYQLKNKQLVGDINKVFYDEKNRFDIDFVGETYKKLSKDTIKDFRVKYFLELKNGDIWIAPIHGGIIRIYDHLTKYENLEVQQIDKKRFNKINSNYLYEHSSGMVFLATDLGIYIWNPKTELFSVLQLPNPSENETLSGMVEDKSGQLWMLFKNYILSYNIDKNLFLYKRLEEYYTIEEKEYPRNLVIDEDFFYFEGFNGIFRGDTKSIFKTSSPNEILITDIYVNRLRIFPGDEYKILKENSLTQKSIDIPYKYRDIGFSFVSIGGDELDVSYFYRLKGYNDIWKKTKERTIHFTNLNEGTYQFEVKAVAGNGLKTPHTKTLLIKVQPPWHRRWYAYVIYTILLSSLAYALYRWRINQILKYQSLRTKISSDLHDDVGTILTGIAMQSEIMSYDVRKTNKSQLQDISVMSRDAMEKMRDIVWALDARKDSYDDLITRMREYAENTIGRKDIQYKFDINITSSLQSINPEQRQNIYLIYKEALANIIKHSNCTEVVITLHKSIGETTMTISDNGSLTKNAQMSSGQGLSNIEMRARRIGGTIHIDSSHGFSITLTIKQ